MFEWFEVYYNRLKLHNKLGYISPEAFEAKKSLNGMSVKSEQDHFAVYEYLRQNLINSVQYPDLSSNS